MNETIMICVTQNDVEHGLASISEISIAYQNLSTIKMRYLFEKNNSWFCYSTLLTQQIIRREGSLQKPLQNIGIGHLVLKHFIFSVGLRQKLAFGPLTQELGGKIFSLDLTQTHANDYYQRALRAEPLFAGNSFLLIFTATAKGQCQNSTQIME